VACERRRGEVRHDDVRAGEARRRDVGEAEADASPEAVEPHVTPRRGQRVAIDVDRRDDARPQPGRRQGEHPRAGPDVEDAPSRDRQRLQGLEAEACRRVVSRPEAARRLDHDHVAIAARAGGAGIPRRRDEEPAGADGTERGLAPPGPVLVGNARRSADRPAAEPPPHGSRRGVARPRGGEDREPLALADLVNRWRRRRREQRDGQIPVGRRGARPEAHAQRRVVHRLSRRCP
jgi:hypothetical protein